MKTASDAARGCAARIAFGVLVLIPLALPSVAAAQRRPSTISLSRARTYFEEMERAWRALRALDVQPADANGAIAGWDRTWARRVARVERATRGACVESVGESSDCAVHERTALLCNAAFDVSTHRSAIYGVVPEAGLSDPFEARRAIADEAARRRREGLSCEDLPSHLEIEGDGSSGWSRFDGRPLIAAPVPDASALPGGGLAAAVITAVVEHERPRLTRCWETAIRGVSPIPSVRLDVSLAIGASGVVTSVAVSGDGIGVLVPCVQRAVRRWRFPEAAATSTTRFAVAFGEPPDEEAR